MELHLEDVKYRKEMQSALCDAIAEAHPHDARQILCAALVTLYAGTPPPALIGSFQEDADWWAAWASPIELEAMLTATAARLGDVGLHLLTLKRLFWTLWKRLPPETRTRFLASQQVEGVAE